MEAALAEQQAQVQAGQAALIEAREQVAAQQGEKAAWEAAVSQARRATTQRDRS